MHFDEFLSVLGLDKKLDLAEAKKAGACSIQFDHKVTVNIENDKSRGFIHAYCAIGQAPLAQRDALFAMLLQAHMFGVATDGCSFGYQPNNDHIILFISMDVSVLNSETATKKLETLVNQSIRWSEYLPKLLENWEEKIAYSAINIRKENFKNFSH